MPHTRHRLLQWVFHPPPDAAPPATLLMRLMAGGVLVGEGLLKWLFPATLGVGRFHALGIPAPARMAPVVGVMEIVGGTLFVLGWCTRLAAIPLMLDLVVAILLTIIPRWLGTSPLPPLVLPPVGVPALLYDLRADVAQLVCAFWLFLGGAGPWAMDALLARTREGGDARATQEGSCDARLIDVQKRGRRQGRSGKPSATFSSSQCERPCGMSDRSPPHQDLSAV